MHSLKIQLERVLGYIKKAFLFTFFTYTIIYPLAAVWYILFYFGAPHDFLNAFDTVSFFIDAVVTYPSVWLGHFSSLGDWFYYESFDPVLPIEIFGPTLLGHAVNLCCWFLVYWTFFSLKSKRKL